MAAPGQRQFPEEPRLSGDYEQDVSALQEMFRLMYEFFQASDAIGARIVSYQEAAGSIQPLTQVISSPPTQAEVQAIQDTVNELLAWAQGSVTEG